MPGSEAPFIRFMRSYRVDDETTCWEWLGQIAPNGYGVIKCFGSMKGAHRLARELYHGPIPRGLEILHSCDNKTCVNPAHLSVGTHRQNMKEAWARGLVVKGKPNPRKGARSSQSRCAVVLGKPYGSLKEAERAIGLGQGTVAYWLRSENPKATEITRAEYYQMTGGPGWQAA